MLFADLKERRARDPSHTVTLRKAFRAKGFLCLRSLRNEMRKVVAEMDLLGLGPEQKSVFAFQSPAQRLHQFRGWLESAAFANLDARWWLYPFIAKAVKTGLDRANKEIPSAHFVPNFASFDNLHALAKNEIDGILASMVQKSTRLAHAAMLRRLSPYAAFNTLTVPLDGDIKNRIALLANFLTIKSHAQAKIAVYRSVGVKQIGIDPEYMRSLKTRGQSHDCRCNVTVFDDDDDDNYAVGWGTADDDDVCVQCDEMAQDSPYLLDEVEDLFPLHPNCLPGGALVSTRDRVLAVSKRLYNGDLIIIRTTCGDVVEITPNHDVLTTDGWLPAHLVDIGHNIVGDLVSERVTSEVTDENNHNVPVRIEQIADAATKLFGAVSVPTSSSDFHGDGTNGEVDIVFANGFLLSELDFASLKHRSKLRLIMRNVSRTLLTGLRAFDSFRQRCLASASSVVCSGSLSGPLFLGHARPLDALLLGSGSHRDVMAFQDSSNQTSSSTERHFDFDATSEFEYTCSDRVQFDDASLNYVRDKTIEQTGVSLAMRLVDAGAPLKKVVFTGKRFFSGHVYNLQTESGHYSANNCIVHNCRCAPYPWPGRATDSTTTLDGENPGHAFRGNQYVEGESGPEGGTATPPPKEKRVAAVNPAVAHVGGDDWNRATAVRTETEYQHAKPELEAAAEKIGTGTETEDEPHTPEGWHDLDEDTKDAAEEHYKDNNLDAELEAAQYSWHDSGDAYHDAQHEVVDSYENSALYDLPWVTKAFAATHEQREEDGDPPIPYSDDQLHKAISIKIDDDDKINVTFDDSKLQEPNNVTPKEQMQLPGIAAEDPSAKLTSDMRKQITIALKTAFKGEAKYAEKNLDPPDYLTDSAHEALDESWSYKSDSDKFEWAKEAGLVEAPDDEDYDNSLTPPTKFDPLEEHGDTTQYKRTGAFARKLAVDRASELLVQRGIAKDADSAAALAHRMDQHLWSDWKDSSTSANGLLMQKACAEEFGGRFNIHAALGSGGAAANLENKIKYAAETFDGMDAVKAYVRAKWETTQYILDKAGIDTVTVYRAINLPKDDLWARDKVGSFTKLPDLKVQRNGAASTTTDLDVANHWGDYHNRIVLRMEVPRTAILSVPAYGQNVYKEHEVVLVGGAMKHWDAWEGQAPSVKSEPFDEKEDHHE